MAGSSLTPAAEEPLPGELEALDEAEAEFAKGQTHRLDDVLHGMGRRNSVIELNTLFRASTGA